MSLPNVIARQKKTQRTGGQSLFALLPLSWVLALGIPILLGAGSPAGFAAAKPAPKPVPVPVTTAPNAPANLKATGQFARVALTFDAVTGATSYNIYRATVAGAEDLTTPTATVAGPHFTDVGSHGAPLQTGTPYFYVITAVNRVGEGAASAEATATPAPDTRVRGGVLAWGDNGSGQLGNGTTTRSLVPTAVGAPAGASKPLTNIVQVVGGTRFSLALTADGKVYAWGDNRYGQLGNNPNYVSFNNGTYIYNPSTGTYTFNPSGSGLRSSGIPGLVQTQQGTPLTGIVAIAAGQDHALALASDGTLWSWGRNQYGQLGLSSSSSFGSSSSFNAYASQVTASVSSANSGSGTNSGSGILSGVVAMAAGAYHSLAVLNDGTVMAWGSNSSGQLGNGVSGPGTDSATPVAVTVLQNAVSVAAGQYHSLALTADGQVYAWGFDGDGELGDGGFGSGTTGTFNGTFNGNVSLSPTPILVQLGTTTPITSIVAGQYHSLSLAQDGSVFSWGSNSSGQLGDGTSGRFSASFFPNQVNYASGASLLGSGIGAGGSHSLVILSDLTLTAFGLNSSGQLGNATTTSSTSPTAVLTASSAQGGSPLASIYQAAGGNLHSLALQNLPPNVTLLTYVVNPKGSRTVPAASGLLSGVTDAEGDGPITARLGRAPQYGTVTVNPDGSFTYTPPTATVTGFNGTDSFTYVANDGLADSVPATVTLKVTTPVLQGLVISPGSASLAEGKTLALSATGIFSDGTTADYTGVGKVTWSSSDATLATVSTAGLVTAVTNNAGPVTITATTPNGLSATSSLTIVRVLKSVTVTPAAPSLPRGVPQQFTAAAAFTDGTSVDATKNVTWSSSKPSVASISNNAGAPAVAATGTTLGTPAVPNTQGLAQSRAPGTTTITATLGAVSGTTSLTVTRATLVSIKVTPTTAVAGTAPLPRGQSRRYKAIGTYTDGTTTDLSLAVQLTTGNSGVAVVDTNGLVSALGVGQTTLTATEPASKIVGTVAITVTDLNVVAHSHILYNLPGGSIALWDVDRKFNVTQHQYGPFVGFSAVALATGADGVSHIAETKADGTLMLGTVDTAAKLTTTQQAPRTDGGSPYKAIALSIGPDNVAHLLSANANNKIQILNIKADGTQAVATTQNTVSDGANVYVPQALATGPDGVSHVLWNNPNGKVMLSNVDATGGYSVAAIYAAANDGVPNTPWSATALSVGTDGIIHIVWNNADGKVVFWNVDSAGNFTIPGVYGPFPAGWKALAVSTDANNLSHLLWGRPDFSVSQWDVNSGDGSFNFSIFGPLAGFSPVAISSGP